VRCSTSRPTSMVGAILRLVGKGLGEPLPRRGWPAWEYDTVSDQAAVALTGSSAMFYNPLAAVPSLHCGFAFAIGIALAAAAQRRWTKALALGWGRSCRARSSRPPPHATGERSRVPRLRT
jgi:PAP2 superfamily